MSAKSVKQRMYVGGAFAIVLIVGMMVVTSFWAFVANIAAEEPAPIAITATNLVLTVVLIFVLGFLLTTTWYKRKMKGVV